MRMSPAMPAMVLAGTLAGCCALSEAPLSCRNRSAFGPSASGPDLPTIVEVGQCPKPIGVYQNENAVDGTGPGLAYYFASPNVRTDPKLGIVRADRSVLDLLIEDDRRGQSYYTQSKGERLTLELRPLTTPARFKVVVRSSLGRTGEGEASLDLSRSADNSTGNRCQGGTVRGIYSKTGKVNVAWWVDRDTGDIVGAYQSALERGELSFRYKKIGD